MSSFLVHTTWGPTDPTRAGLAFTAAMTAKKQGHDVVLFLFHDAVLFARKEFVEKAIPLGPPSLKECADFLVQNKVRILACKPCVELRGMKTEELLSGTELKGMTEFI
ncbi:MAG: DsrE family protein, partial [Candidatus Woesearchaeota archaeon]|nr:DsrE family protein [Candidatus Woesearchaeota archaeon]